MKSFRERQAQQRVLLVKYGIESGESASMKEQRLELTERERLTLALYAVSGSQKQVAHEMGISLQTIKNNVGAAYLKLGASNAIEAFTILGWLQVRDHDWHDDVPITSTGTYWTIRLP